MKLKLFVIIIAEIGYNVYVDVISTWSVINLVDQTRVGAMRH